MLWSAGLTLAAPKFSILSSVMAEEKPQALLSVAKGETYISLVSKVLAPLGGMKQFVQPGN